MRCGPRLETRVLPADRFRDAWPAVARRPLDALTAEPKAEVANGFASEALLQFPKNLRFRDLLEFVVERGLEDADVKSAFAQRDRCGMGGDKFADDRGPGVDYFAFA